MNEYQDMLEFLRKREEQNKTIERRNFQNVRSKTEEIIQRFKKEIYGKSGKRPLNELKVIRKEIVRFLGMWKSYPYPDRLILQEFDPRPIHDNAINVFNSFLQAVDVSIQARRDEYKRKHLKELDWKKLFHSEKTAGDIKKRIETLCCKDNEWQGNFGQANELAIIYHILNEKGLMIKHTFPQAIKVFYAEFGLIVAGDKEEKANNCYCVENNLRKKNIKPGGEIWDYYNKQFINL